MAQKIYIIDRDVDLSSFLKLKLLEEGFEVDTFDSALDAIQQLKSETPTLIIMEFEFNRLTGSTVLTEVLNLVKDTPVIILTDKNELEHVLNAFHLGAADYITKPFDYNELLARVKSRLNISTRRETIEYKDILIDLGLKRAFKNKKDLKLTSKEYFLLSFLIENKGQLISRDKILERVWNSEKLIVTRSVDIYIARLRKKLGDKKEKYIKTHVGFGYIVPGE